MDSTNSPEIHWRGFLAAMTAAAAFMIVSPRPLARAGAVAANSPIQVEFIGFGSQKLRVMFDFLPFPEVQAVAVADPLRSAAYYHQWGKNEFRDRVQNLLGVRSGWDWLSPNAPILSLSPTLSVPAGVARRKPAQRTGDASGCTAFAAFREMLDNENDIDAVVGCTTDLLHAPAAIAAMKRGKHVFCQQRMSHSLPTARLMAEVAKSSSIATQAVLPEQASEETRRLCEWLSAVVMGRGTRVDNWSNRPSWPQGSAPPTDSSSLPERLDWNLWLGPTPSRPFHPAYLPFVWRGWTDYGCGAFGDMGCYSLDSIYHALKLTAPIAAEASGSGHSPETFPKASIIHLDFPARDGLPSVNLTCYLGGLNRDAMDFYPKTRRDAFTDPPKTLPRSSDNEREWLDAVKEPKPPKPGACFEFAAMVTEALHLGNLAARTSERLTWDSASSKLGASPAAPAMAR